LGRRLSFWIAVGGVSILSNFALELAAQKLPSAGLKRFAQFVHCGPGRG
jgi:hypothetical protein